MIQGAPPDAQKSPEGYYYWLVSNGFPHNVAYDEMTKVFGPPKTQEEIEREKATNERNAQLAQVGGTVAGAGLTGWAMNGFNLPEWLKSKPPVTTTPTTPTAPTAPSAPAPNVPAANIPSAGAPSGANLPNVDTNIDLSVPEFSPKVIKTEGGMSTIETPAGVQQVPTESLNDSGFWSNVNWGQVVQGGLALAQMYGAYKSFKSGDKVGGAINMAAGAGNMATATGAISTGAAAGTTGAYVIPGLNILAGGYAGYQTAEALGDMAAGSKRTQTGVVGGATAGASIGAGIGSIVPGVGTGIGAAVGAVVGATAGAIGSWTGSSKGKAQMMRDQIRGVLQQGGILDDKFQGTLADGSKYDFGKDGSTLKWKEIDKVAAAQPKAWSKAAQLGDAMAVAYGFVGQKASDISAMYAKGAVSNAGDDENIAQKNMQHFAQQQGLTYEGIKAKLDEAMKDNRISQSQYDYYLGGARQLTAGVKPPMQTAGNIPPAPRPGATPPPAVQEAPQQTNKKMSIGDVLRQNMNKGK